MPELRVNRPPGPVAEASTAAFISPQAAAAPGRGLESAARGIAQVGQFASQLAERLQKSDDWKNETMLKTRMETIKQELIQSNTPANTADWITNLDGAFKDFGTKEFGKISGDRQEQVKSGFDFAIERLKTEWITKQNVQQQREKTAVLNTAIDGDVNNGDKKAAEVTLRGALEAGVISQVRFDEMLPKALRAADIQSIEAQIVDDPWLAQEMLEKPKKNGLEHLTAMDIRIRGREAQEQINRYNTENWKSIDAQLTIKSAGPEAADDAADLIKELLGEDTPSDEFLAKVIADMSGTKQSVTDWSAFVALKEQAALLNPNDEDHTKKLEIFQRNLVLANFDTDTRKLITKTRDEALEGFENKGLADINEKRKIGRELLKFAKLDGQFGDLYDYETERVTGTERQWFWFDTSPDGKFRFLHIRDGETREDILDEPNRTAGFGQGFDPRAISVQKASKTQELLNEQFDTWLEANPDAGVEAIHEKIGEMTFRAAVAAGVNSINPLNQQPEGEVSVEDVRAVLGKL